MENINEILDNLNLSPEVLEGLKNTLAGLNDKLSDENLSNLGH
jgi:hypothetical protein